MSDVDRDTTATVTLDNGSFELSELDQRILELNQQGLSGAQISKALKSEGIELSKRSVLRHLTELRQDPDNDVQVNFECTYQKPKSEQKWYNTILKLQEMITEYVRRQGFKPSARTMFYDLQDLGLLNANEYNTFSSATVKARLGWTDSNGELIYPKLDIDCFSDDSRLTVDAYDDREPREPTEPSPIEDPTRYIRYEIRRLKQAPHHYDGTGMPGSPGVIGGYWYGQPEYVEVWEEKNDLIKGFEKILKDKRVNIRANKGYSSLEFLFECTEKLK